MTASYALPASIEKLSTPLSDLALCEARLVTDGRFMWVALVPKRAGVVEFEDLSPPERVVMMEEIVEAGRRVRAMGEAIGRPVEKLNVAQFGNQTRELHIHVIGRRGDDEAWPKPIWSAGPSTPWNPADVEKATAAWKAA